MDSDRIPRVPPYSGYCYLFTILHIRGFHSLWPTFPDQFRFVANVMLQSFNPDIAVTISVWAVSSSLAATKEIDVSFSSSWYLDVSVPRVPDVQLCIHCTTTEVCSVRFPHSEICGSMCICHSPQLIAAYHVFHRLLVPRHPPCALLRLTILITSV